jgi:hypothetical protein
MGEGNVGISNGNAGMGDGNVGMGFNGETFTCCSPRERVC